MTGGEQANAWGVGGDDSQTSPGHTRPGWSRGRLPDLAAHPSPSVNYKVVFAGGIANDVHLRDNVLTACGKTEVVVQ